MPNELRNFLIGGLCYFLGLVASISYIDGPTGFNSWYYGWNYRGNEIWVMIIGYTTGTYFWLQFIKEDIKCDSLL